MPDIAMCTESRCPLRLSCYRYMAAPSMYQTYSKVNLNKNGSCDDHYKIPMGAKLNDNK